MSINVLDKDGNSQTLDPATQTTLAAILAKLIAAPATEAKQDTGNTSLASIVTALSSQATATKQDALAALIGEVQASPTSNTLLDRLKALATLLASQATAANQTTGNTSLASIVTLLTTQAGYLDGVETLLGTAATAANQATQITALGALTETAPASDTASSGINGRLQRIAQRLSSLITALGSPAQDGTDATGVTMPTGGAGIRGWLSGIYNKLATTIAVTQSGAWSFSMSRPATPAQSSVAGSATSVSLLASNTSRLGATIYNDSTALLYLKLGATASTTSYSLQIAPYGYYEIPYAYTGAIDGIWSSATGNARISELT